MAFRFESQLAATRDRESAALVKIKQLKQELSLGRDRIRKLEVEVEAKRNAKREFKEASNAQRLKIKIEVVKRYKKCPEYHNEFGEYGTRAFMTCFDEVTRAMIKRGVDATLLVLVELKKSLIPSEPTH